MKIAIVSDWFSDGVGYAENYLPPAMGRLGHEVHVLSSDFQIYGTSADYDKVYRARLGEAKVGVGVNSRDGFTLHRFKGHSSRWGIEVPELGEALTRLAPQVVYCFEITRPTTVTVAVRRRGTGYRMFCESRLHTSVLESGFVASLKWKLWARMMGVPTVLRNVDTFYPIAPDVLRNITQHLGVAEERCRLASLAVDTHTFHPSSDPGRRVARRQQLGFRDTDLVCVYTGRMTPSKGPLVLAQAVDALQSRGVGHVRALFVGEGDSDYVARIASSKGCVVHPFVSPSELPDFYQCADIGVWPLQESTSQLDAMACGLPLIINDTVEDPIRLGDVGAIFRKDDVEHLASRILELQDAGTRAAMGARAAARIAASCSWDSLARDRIADFERASRAQ